jgi:hypothetical protein
MGPDDAEDMFDAFGLQGRGNRFPPCHARHIPSGSV